MKYSKSLRISLICIATLLNGGAVMVVSAVLQAQRNIPVCLLMGALFTVMFYGIGWVFRHVNKWTRIVLLIATPLVLWRLGIFGLLGEIAEKYLQWFYTYDLAEASPPMFAVTITMIVAGIISALYTTPLVARRPRVLVVLIIFLTILFLPYRYIDPDQMRIANTIIVSALLYLVVLSGYIHISQRYNGKLQLRPYQTIGLVLCALVTFVSTVFSFSQEGQPKWFDNSQWTASDNTFFSFMIPFRASTAKLNDTGKVRLGGDNQTGNLLLFDVRTDELFYFYADTYDRYTGTAWESTGDSKILYYPQRYKAIQDADESYMFNAEMTIMPLSILYHNLSTDRLLLPKHVEQVRIISGDNTIYLRDDLTLTVDPDAKKGFTYEAWARINPLTYIADEIVNYSDYADYYESHERYLKLPDSVTDRTRELAMEITADGGSDIEKATLVQNYLSRNYPYTLDAPELPAGADFVDFFLFEAETGYCTSYSSAMVVMLRTLGIPARYCEGFAPNPKNYIEGVYHVYESDAHAWVEVYSPYSGWVEFDPTGSSNAAVYRRNQTRRQEEASGVRSETEGENGDALAAEERYNNAENQENQGKNMPEEPVHIKTEKEIAEERIGEILNGLRDLAIIAAFPVLWIFGGRLYVRMTLESVKKKTSMKQARFWYARIHKLLKGEGHVIHGYESMREFITRIQEDLPSSGTDLLPAIALMEKVIYNEQVIMPEEVPVFTSAHNQLSSGLHAGWGKIRQWWETNITFRLLWDTNR